MLEAQLVVLLELQRPDVGEGERNHQSCVEEEQLLQRQGQQLELELGLSRPLLPWQPDALSSHLLHQHRYEAPN